MSEFLTIGEPVVTFGATDADMDLADALNYKKILGGAELNVAVGVTRLGHSAQYISAVGADPLGEFTKRELARENISTDYISETPDYWTAFQLKQRVTKGDPETFNFRKGSAAAHLTAAALDKIDFSEVKMVHLSGIFPAISQTARATFRHLIDLVEEHHVPTTYDPNLRPALWESEEVMIETVNDLAKHGEIVLPGINEGEVLMGSRDPETIADFYLNNSPRTHTVIVKLGAAGAFVKTAAGESYTVPGFKVDHVVDTVGAGDGFALGIITALLEGLSMPEAVRRANAVGALAVQAPGDNDGYPTQQQLAEFYTQHEA